MRTAPQRERSLEEHQIQRAYAVEVHVEDLEVNEIAVK